jgi:hypothetical protein
LIVVPPGVVLVMVVGVNIGGKGSDKVIVFPEVKLIVIVELGF